ncbi:LysR family transcriptional regulator [Faecalispora anaeroviscerum]|uniref:LysR family transcriptional regulator n=1 Tax=Faecalispora anaeroviscerum TaxID=2991836 RepID=UPI0024B94806|nr:LysR family transcriptional regulator [Faecalispora anaeroviscerum]
MFQTLKYVYEIYKEGSFSRAAKNLYISQPSLSATIKKLELDIGITIFDRSTTPVQLTDAGKVYIETTRQILQLQSNLESYLQDYTELKTGTLKLAGPQFFASYFMAPLISKFNSLYPGIQLQLNEASTPELQQKLLDSEIDLVVDSSVFDNRLFTSYPLREEHILLAVPEQYEINRQLSKYRMTARDVCMEAHRRPDCKPVDPTLFRDFTFLLLHKGHNMNAFATGLFEQYHFIPRRTMYLDQLMTSYNLVKQQIGMAFVSDTVIKRTSMEPGAYLYRVEAPNVRRYIYLAHKKNRYISKAMREFIALSQQVYQENQESEQPEILP